MSSDESVEDAIDILQSLGLSELEARCYVGLTRMDVATAKKLSEVAEIPRTRVYDATRVLNANGLIDVQHTRPKRFRAASTQEAIDQLRDRYDASFVELQEALDTIEPVESKEDVPSLQVWAVTGRETIDLRAIQLVEDAAEQVVLGLGDESLLTPKFIEAITEAGETLELVIYAPTEAICDRIQDTFPDATTVVSGSELLHGMTASVNHATLGRILLIDQSASLMSSIDLDTGEEQAVFSQGPKPPVLSLLCQLVVEDGSVEAPDPEP